MKCLIGHFGDDEDDLNQVLLQASAEFESIITPRATAPSLGLALSRVPGSVYNMLRLLQPNPLLLTSPPVRLRCHRGSTELHRGSTGIRAMLLTNQIAVFQIGRL